MDKESKSGFGNLSGNGLVAVALLAAGVLFVRETPLETTRLPVNESRLDQHFSLQDIDARLWQDPFGAVAKGRAEARKNRPERAAQDDQRTAENLAKEINRRGQPVEILAVMLPGGPYSDNVESRRRARYAIMGGLNASRLAPEETEHLGYFFPLASGNPARTLPETVPYEWFGPATDVRQREKSGRQPSVLVMWLQSDAFGSKPLQRMKDLAHPFSSPRVSWRVLGPNGSDGLKAMIDEVADPNFKHDLLSGTRMRFYSPYATVPDHVLLPAAEERTLTLADFFAKKGVMLVRTIGDDERLADSLIDELERRGLSPRKLEREHRANDASVYREVCRAPRGGNNASPSHIAVVAEWDTLYGRTLRREFKATHGERGFCVEAFSYVRGLDGQLPAGGDAAPAAGAGGKQTQADKDPGRRRDGTFIELAEGQSQFDYLRRVAAQMRERDRRVRQSSADGFGLRAIGVLGNDVHDKLVVLQALQPEFPNAIFFTTDLDARFLHPREQAWARNLIVASNFGLRLVDGVQGVTPPFRDGYQTATYLSTRLAMDDARRASQPTDQVKPGESLPRSQSDISRWFVTPRIFEIGRTAAFDFSGDAVHGALRTEEENICRGRDWAACTDIHPPPSPHYPTPPKAMLFLIFSLVVLALWAPALLISPGAGRALSHFAARAHSPARRLARYGALAALVALLQFGLPLWMAAKWERFAAWLTHNGKPLVAFEGISLWPTEGIRLFTLLLCFYLVFRGWVMLSDNLDEISLKFRLGKTRRELVAEQREVDARLRWWQRLARMFSMGFVASPGPERPADHGMPAAALDFWKEHIVQNRLVARFARTAACVLVTLLCSYLLVQAFGEDRLVPQRGELSRAVHYWLRIPTLVMMYFLVFFVVDATVFCVGFMRGLREHAANWPVPTLDTFERQLGIPRAHLDNWIDLQFIALRTPRVTQLIYYPFIVLSLLLVSRSAVFDDWYTPMIIIILTVGGAAVALGCALALRQAAEASRRHALDQVEDALMRANAKAAAVDPTAPPPATPASADAAALEQPTVKQLELLHARIENLRQGAFAPFWQQPLVKAVLLPFATLGGTTLLDYMALANL